MGGAVDGCLNNVSGTRLLSAVSAYPDYFFTEDFGKVFCNAEFGIPSKSKIDRQRYGGDGKGVSATFDFFFDLVGLFTVGLIGWIGILICRGTSTVQNTCQVLYQLIPLIRLR